MRAQIPFDYYPSLAAKCGITGHNFAYLAGLATPPALDEHKAAHSNYYCYEDMADALKSVYEKEERARQSYG